VDAQVHPFPEAAFDLATSVFGAMTHDLAEAGRVAALEALHASLVAHDTDDGVVFSGSAWLVTAGSGP